MAFDFSPSAIARSFRGWLGNPLEQEENLSESFRPTGLESLTGSPSTSGISLPFASARGTTTGAASALGGGTAGGSSSSSSSSSDASASMPSSRQLLSLLGSTHIGHSSASSVAESLARASSSTSQAAEFEAAFAAAAAAAAAMPGFDVAPDVRSMFMVSTSNDNNTTSADLFAFGDCVLSSQGLLDARTKVR